MLGVLLIKFFINKSCFWYFRWFVVIQFIMHVSAFVVVRQWRNYAGLLLSNYITFCSVFECNIIHVQSNYFSSESNQYHNLFFCNSNSRVIIFFQLSPFFLKNDNNYYETYRNAFCGLLKQRHLTFRIVFCIISSIIMTKLKKGWHTSR